MEENTWPYIDEINKILFSLKEKNFSEKEKQEKAIEVASLIVKQAKLQRVKYAKNFDSISNSLQDPRGKALIIYVIDIMFRVKDPKKLSRLIGKQIARLGIPSSLTFSLRLSFFIFRYFYKWFYKILIPWAKKNLLFYCLTFVTTKEKKELKKFDFLKDGLFNVEYIKEESIGEEDVKEYLDTYLTYIAESSIDSFTIKISGISSKIKINAWEYSLEKICHNLRLIFSEAKKHKKFISLDMENYKYLHLTVAAFKTVLEEKEFLNFSAGITLQSYLPDSFNILQNLVAFAKERADKNGAPIKINIVKGAYLSYEQIIASQKGWPQAPFLTKNLTDANFKKMVQFCFKKENAKVANVVICTHNIFDIAYALVLRSENNLESFVDFQILQGRIRQIKPVLQKLLDKNFRVFHSVISLDEISNAVYFLQRRLEENVGNENFLKFASEISLGTNVWSFFESQFLQSFEEIDKLPSTPRRSFNNQTPTLEVYEGFENESDIDFNVPSSLIWQKEIIDKWKNHKQEKIPLVIGGKEIYAEEKKFNFCPVYLSYLYEYSVADKNLFDLAISKAKLEEEKWAKVSFEQKKIYLERAAQILRETKQDLIGSTMVDVSKLLKEVDHEVAMSIDLIEYYLNRYAKIIKMKDVIPHPKGTTIIASSRSFPLSTSSGKIIAALLTGNTVIFKPSPDTVLSAWHLVNVFWKAGIPKEVLQFVNCSDVTFDAVLQDGKISLLSTTASSETVDKFIKINPRLDISASSEGKNIIIITSAADRSLAVKHLIKSAFTFSGQKYSSSSIAILEKEVYEDLVFRKNLVNATLNLDIGSIFEFHTDIGPLLRRPIGKVLKVMTTLEEGEEWLLKPTSDPSNPFIWSCGIKMGMKTSSLLYNKFLPCPVLGIMVAKDLKHAIDLANGVEWGLTAGLESLDEEEQKFWKESIEAGTLYINRPIIKAVIRRQPFGGCKRSSYGKTFKVGGPNYLVPWINPEEIELPKEKKSPSEKVKKFSSIIENYLSSSEKEIWDTSIANYAFWWQKMSVFRDPIKILGQDNFFGYVPLKNLTFRIDSKDKLLDVFRICASALTCGSILEISFESKKSLINFYKINSFFKVVDESYDEFLLRVEKGIIKRIKVISPPCEKLLKVAAEKRCFIDKSLILTNGRYELLNYLRELSISYDYHRFGNLGARESELRKPSF